MEICKETKERMMEYAETGGLSHDIGLCIHCGNEMEGVEPDARRYLCDSCGKRGVYGLEELAIMLFF